MLMRLTFRSGSGARNSARVAGSSRSRPNNADVTVFEPGTRAPRSVMQVCSASTTTPDALRGQSYA